jgi:hypothetical protein
VSNASIIRASLLAVLGIASYWVLRLASPIPEAADSMQALQRAAVLDPSNAARFERLGQRAELDGDLALAESSLLRAAGLSRLYQPRYLLAQYYFRRNDRQAFTRWSREAYSVAPHDVTPLLDLALRMNPDAADLTEQALRGRPSMARQFLFFLVRNQEMGAAAKIARSLAETGVAEDRRALLGFCDQALADADLASALEIWSALCRRKMLPYEPGSPVTNGDFLHPTVSSGFDWHLEKGTTQGTAALHIDLTDVAADSVLAWQYAALRRGARYRLRYEIQGGAKGLGWSVFYPIGGQWKEWPGARTLEFEAPSGIIRLALMNRSRSEGTAGISAVRLELQQ